MAQFIELADQLQSRQTHGYGCFYADFVDICRSGLGFTLRFIMKNHAPSWLFPEGASVDSLPSSYLSLLSVGNGGEVGLHVNPFTLCLDPAESALDYWRNGTNPMSGVFVFGGSGGGEMLAFDLRAPAKWSVVSFDPIDPEGSIQQIAHDFESFLELVKEQDA